MLVEEWMTSKVITITPDTSMMKAARLMKDNSIRRLPVVDENNKILGIVSDRDVKDASPSKATTLEVHELYYLLSELKVKDIMTKNPKCAKRTDSVEGTALLMMKYSFGGVPVIEDDGTVCGIITDSDIFQVLISITGIRHGGLQLALELENKEGTLKQVLDAVRSHGAQIISVLTSKDDLESSTRRVYIRLLKLSSDKEKELVTAIEKDFPLLYWEDGITTD